MKSSCIVADRCGVEFNLTACGAAFYILAVILLAYRIYCGINIVFVYDARYIDQETRWRLDAKYLKKNFFEGERLPNMYTPIYRK